MLWDRGGEDGMIKKITDYIKLKKHLNYKNFEIYAAHCNECEEYYVGQTITSFSKRCCSHIHNWKNIIKYEISYWAAFYSKPNKV